MPKEQYLTWAFIRGVCDGSKKLLRCKDISVLEDLPKLSSLSCEDIWSAIRLDKDVSRYFPTDSEKYPGKSWMLSVYCSLQRCLTL